MSEFLSFYFILFYPRTLTLHRGGLKPAPEPASSGNPTTGDLGHHRTAVSGGRSEGKHTWILSVPFCNY